MTPLANQAAWLKCTFHRSSPIAKKEEPLHGWALIQGGKHDFFRGLLGRMVPVICTSDGCQTSVKPRTLRTRCGCIVRAITEVNANAYKDREEPSPTDTLFT